MQYGNKHDELDVCVQLGDYDLPWIMDTWWGGICDWSIALEEYRLIRKDSLEKMKRGSFLLCERAAEVHRVLAGDG